ncbi:MAG: FAD:protein FMN transferase [Gemmatimonadaceae bacterium]|nr:FAD:protein FMN transferase [Gemmatimonadaceae bacterium]
MTGASRTFSVAQASRRWWLLLVVLSAASLYAYRARDRAAPTAARFGGPAQGTTYSVVLGHARPDSAVASLRAAVDSVLADVDRTMSTYDSTSELSRFNRHARTEPLTISPALAAVIGTALEVSKASQGAFDITVGALVDAWGFGARGDLTRAPDSSELVALRARVGWQQLHLNGGELSKQHPALQIDLSAVAPGYTVDLLSDLLVARGESDHFVEVGGEVRARGRNIEGQPFRVGIEDPVRSQRRVRLVVGLADQSLSTSGNYRDYRIVDGVTYVHTIDPTVGRPVTHGLLSVSVLHESCAHADAWATALLVVGPERAWEMAQANGLAVLLLVAGAEGKVEERMTDAFRQIVVPRASLPSADNRQ